MPQMMPMSWTLLMISLLLTMLFMYVTMPSMSINKKKSIMMKKHKNKMMW